MSLHSLLHSACVCLCSFLGVVYVMLFVCTIFFPYFLPYKIFISLQMFSSISVSFFPPFLFLSRFLSFRWNHFFCLFIEKCFFPHFFCSIWCGYRAIYWITNSKYTKMLENTDWKPSHANKPPNKNSCLAFPRISFENGWIKIGNSFDKMFFSISFWFFFWSHLDHFVYILQENAFIQLFWLALNNIRFIYIACWDGMVEKKWNAFIKSGLRTTNKAKYETKQTWHFIT